MSKHSKAKKEGRDIRAEASKLAANQQFEGQNKEQSRLIAKAIQKGIEQYLRQQGDKSRALDKQSKKLKKLASVTERAESALEEKVIYRSARLPWVLAAVSWLVMFIVLWFSSYDF